MMLAVVKKVAFSFLVFALCVISISCTVDTADLLPVLDQEQAEVGSLFSESTSHWQSFTAGRSGLLTAININPWHTNPESDYTLNLYSGEGIGGVSFYSQSGIFIEAGTGPEEFMIVLSGVASVVAGQMYTWELSHASDFQLVGYFWTSYDRGKSDYFETNVESDLFFQTYVRPND